MRAKAQFSPAWEAQPLVGAGPHATSRISASTCSAALMSVDLAITSPLLQQSLPIPRLLLLEASVILSCGVVAALISLWLQGAYTMASGRRTVRAVAFGWVNASAWLALGWYGYGAFVNGLMLLPVGLQDQEWLGAVCLIGGTAGLGRSLLGRKWRCRAIARIAKKKIVGIGLDPSVADALQRHYELSEITCLTPDFCVSSLDDVIALVQEGGGRRRVHRTLRGNANAVVHLDRTSRGIPRGPSGSACKP